MTTPNPHPTKAFRLSISVPEWKALNHKATLSGHTTVHRYLRTELYRFYRMNKDLPQATGKAKRTCRHYDIPPDLLPFYSNLAELLNTNVSKIVQRLIIAPGMVTEQNENLIIQSLRSQGATNQTATPVFTSPTGVRYNVTPKDQKPL